MRKPDVQNVEVDMVPLIDIISLLLMFLIIVGDTTASNSGISMKLPAADQARRDSWNGLVENRIVIQVKSPAENDKDRKYYAVFNGARHSMEDDSLKAHLQKYVDDELQHSRAHVIAPDDTLDIAVKLRIPEECPMTEAGKVLKTLADVKLVNIMYAARK